MALLTQNNIALIFDSDLTLHPDYMQKPLFKEYNVDWDKFWKEVIDYEKDIVKKGGNYSMPLPYMNMILRYVKKGKFKGLSNKKLRESGKKLEFYAGMPEFMKRMDKFVQENKKYKMHDIKIKKYIITTGLAEIIKGSRINKYIDEIFGGEFYEDKKTGTISEITNAISYTEKTRYIFEINKGKDVDVNAKMSRELRAIPLSNMIYIGDGPSDIPCFSIIDNNGGYGFAVYNPEKEKSFNDAYGLMKEKRVTSFGPADYTEGSHISKCIQKAITEIADKIIKNREKAINEGIGKTIEF
jgi:hypothetical protein